MAEAPKPSIEQYQRAIMGLRREGDTQAADLLERELTPLVRAKSYESAAADMSTGERALANWGAGVESAGYGVRQVLPGFKAPTDEEIRDKRERDAALAKATETGLGADWMPSIGSVLQFGGEVSPSLAVPLGGVGRAVATKVLPEAASALARTLVRTGAEGAAGGAIGGALMPTTEDESRTANVALGAAGGTVLPGAIAAARVVKGIPGLFTAAGGRQRAGSVLRQSLGEEFADDIALQAEQRARARLFQPKPVRDIPESLSEATGSSRAARVESEARRDPVAGPTWDDFVREQNASRYDAIKAATREEGSLETRAASRERTAGPLRERALAQAEQDPWFHLPALQAAEDALAGPAGVNPAVRTVANYVRNSIGAKADTAMTPARLYEVRKVLVDKLNGPHIIGDDLSAATKGAQRETMGLVDGIDQALNDASSGSWQAYLNRYQDKSRPVNASRAARDARAVFEDPGIPEIGGAPEVTLARIKAAQKAGRSNFDPRTTDFSPQAQRTLEAVEEQYVRAQEPAKVRKLVGTQGGGSQTSTDIDASLKALTTRARIPVISSVVEYLTQGSTTATRTELSRLLQNPTEAAKAIRAASSAGKQLSEAQRLLLEATTRAIALETPALLSEQ